MIKRALSPLLRQLESSALIQNGVIPWGAPIPVFGRLNQSRVATLGINPSNREFVDTNGLELDGDRRRFHTLKSLGLTSWKDVKNAESEKIWASCEQYFNRNPYDGWFRALNHLISGTTSSYYDNFTSACHLDLVPFATASKWTDISKSQKDYLLKSSASALGMLLKNSPVEIIVVNGRTVVAALEKLSEVKFEEKKQDGWTLARASGRDVIGYSFQGVLRNVGGIPLLRDVLVLGFNHNVQSSFGVTTAAKAAIKTWITKEARKATYETV